MYNEKRKERKWELQLHLVSEREYKELSWGLRLLLSPSHTFSILAAVAWAEDWTVSLRRILQDQSQFYSTFPLIKANNLHLDLKQKRGNCFITVFCSLLAGISIPSRHSAFEVFQFSKAWETLKVTHHQNIQSLICDNKGKYASRKNSYIFDIIQANGFLGTTMLRESYKGIIWSLSSNNAMFLKVVVKPRRKSSCWMFCHALAEYRGHYIPNNNMVNKELQKLETFRG